MSRNPDLTLFIHTLSEVVCIFAIAFQKLGVV